MEKNTKKIEDKSNPIKRLMLYYDNWEDNKNRDLQSLSS